MQEIHRKLLESGGITWVPPVHALKITTLAKIAMDKILALVSPQMQMTSKVGGLIVVTQHDWMNVANPFRMFCSDTYMFFAEFA